MLLHYFALPRLQLLSKGEQGDKNYTQVVPWMESLMFRNSDSGDGGGDRPARDCEVRITTPHDRMYKLN